MNHTLRTTLAGSLIVGTLGTGLVLAPGALAKDGGGHDVRVRVHCATGTLSLKAKPDDGRLEVEAELDTNRVGQSWTWTLRHDGHNAASGTRRTEPRSGSFSVERRVPNPRGADSISFRAVRAATGQTCVASVRI